MIELFENAVHRVNGGAETDVAGTWGNWVGQGLSEVKEHPIGAMFGITGIIIAHYLTK